MRASILLSLVSFLQLSSAISARRSTNPTFILVPGAWHVPWHFSFLANILQSWGYKSTTVSLPTVSVGPPWHSYADDVTAVATALREQVNEGNDVIVVMHSYGGVPGSAACQDLTKAARQKAGFKGGVIGVLYIAAFAFDTNVGFSSLDLAGLTWFTIHGPYVSVNSPAHTFYADVPQPLQGQAVAHIQNFSTAGFSAIEAYGVWHDVHPVYITTTEDQALPPTIQQSFYSQAGAKNGWTVIPIASSHAPFLSHTLEMAGILVTFAKNLTSAGGW